MKYIELSSIALLTTLLTSVSSFATPKALRAQGAAKPTFSSTRLSYRDSSDVDDSVFESPATVVESPVQLSAEEGEAVLSVKSIQDYHDHVVKEDEKITILRFSAPWCRVCKATSLAYEGMAKKLKESHSSRVKFLSVDIDGKEGTNQLKESLNIKSVPMGLIYHPSVGAVGQVKLGRANLSELKKRLHRFLDDDERLDVVLEGLLVQN
mmetsp:Transcript_6970/g.13986  ORF Transcript_6970/g.13986 Transcript_6970/m.13986 type:complete len:209 (-) Transcript_6970:107-733(-)